MQVMFDSPCVNDHTSYPPAKERMMKRMVAIDNDEINFLCTEIDKKILTRLGAPKKLVFHLWYNGVCFDPDGTCGRVVRGLFPHGIEDQGNMKPAHHRQDDDHFPDFIQASPFGRTRAIFRMVEYAPLIGMYPPDDIKGKARRDAIKGIDWIRHWFRQQNTENT
jgi:hypothetical protein